MFKILLVEDDNESSKAIVEHLSALNYLVEVACDGEQGWQMAVDFDYDLIVLNWELPKVDGLTLCEKLRERGYSGAILLLTTKDSTRDKIRGLDCGADDYLVKPIDLKEFSARIRAMLRRGSESTKSIVTFGSLTLDSSAYLVTSNGQSVSLTPTEYRLLNFLLRNPNRIFSNEELLDRLWTTPNRNASELIKAHIKGLRRNLKASGITQEVIETVRGLGYRLSCKP
ncbi:MAG: response regulator transcription factor [Candidatus Obscuribacterales bacterium]|nr:response regulator transcription factor [Candidatus Obscuribacterales bacterium]